MIRVYSSIIAITTLCIFLFIGCYSGTHFLYEPSSSTDSSGATKEEVSVVEAESISNSEVLITFDLPMDKTTVEDTANYAIDDLIVIYAEQSATDDTQVLLNTTPQEAGKIYTVTVTSVLSTDGKTVGQQNHAEFIGYEDSIDTQCPSLVIAESSDNITVLLSFSERINLSSALAAENYAIDGLSVVSAMNLGNPTQIALRTSEQTESEYEITITGVEDTAGNEVCSPASISFIGKSEGDETPPRITNLTVKDGTTLIVEFSESIQIEDLETLANFSITDLVIQSVGSADEYNQTAVITTDAMLDQAYTLTVNNVHDLSDNLISLPKTWSFNGYVGPDISPPFFILAEPTSNTSVMLTFNESVSTDFANTKANFSITGLTISNAERNPSNDKQVILTTAAQADTSYTVTASQCEDLLGNTSSSPQDKDFIGDIPPYLSDIEVVASTSITVVFSENIVIADLETLGNYSIPSLAVQSVSALVETDGTAYRAVITTTEQSSTTYTLTVDGVHDLHGNVIGTPKSMDFEGTTGSDVYPPYLSNVQSLDYETVEVTFSEPVEAGTGLNGCELLTNYSINDGSNPLNIISAVQSGTHPNKVILTTAWQDAKPYNITVINVNDQAMPSGNSIGNPKTWSFLGIKAPDITPPSLLNAISLSHTSVEITFSEAVDSTTAENIAHYSFDNGLTVSAAVINPSYPDRVTLTTSEQYNLLYTVSVSNIQDLATPTPNTMTPSPQTKSFTGTKEIIAPFITHLTVIDSSTIDVTFSESIKQSELEDSGNYSIPGLTILSAVSASVANDKVRLSTSYQNAVSYTLTVSNVHDLSDNLIGSPKTWPFTGIAGPDLTPPDFLSVMVLSNQSIELTFSEPVDQATAEDEGNYSIDNGLGVVLALRSGTNPAKVILTTDSQSDMTYTVTASGIEDEAATPNTMAAPQNHTFSGDVKPCIHGVTAINATTTKVTFSETVIVPSASTNTYYTLTGYAGLTVSNATLDGSDPSIVWLTHNNYVGTPTLTLTVINVQDANGNAINAIPTCNEKDFTGNGDLDTTPPTLVDATALSPTQILVTFNELLNETTAETIGNYGFSPAMTVSQAELDTSGTNRKVTLTVTNMDQVTYTLTVSNVTDAAGNSIQAPDNTDTFVGDAIPCVLDVISTGPRKVRVQFSENVNISTSENVLNYSIPGLTLSSAQRDTSEYEYVHLNTSKQTGGFGYTCTVTNVKDMIGNVVGSGCDEDTFSGTPDIVPPVVVSAYPIDDQTVEVVFDEPIQETGAELAGNYSCNGLPIINAVLQADPTRVRLTTHYQHNSTYQLTVTTGIKDEDGNSCVSPNNAALFTGAGNAPIFINDFEGFSSINDFYALGWVKHDDTEATNTAPSNWYYQSGKIIQSSNIHGGPSPYTNPNRWGTYQYYNVDIGADYWMEGYLSSTDNDRIGYLVRYTDEDHFYRFEWYLETPSRSLIKVNGAGNTATVLDTESVGYTMGQVYLVRIAVEGTNLKVFVDGTLILEATDSSLATGYPGFYSWGNQNCNFHDIRIHSIP